LTRNHQRPTKLLGLDDFSFYAVRIDNGCDPADHDNYRLFGHMLYERKTPRVVKRGRWRITHEDEWLSVLSTENWPEFNAHKGRRLAQPTYRYGSG
jgi:hypothetical protein